MQKVLKFLFMLVLGILMIPTKSFSQQQDKGLLERKVSDSIFETLHQQLATSKEQPHSPQKIAQNHLNLGEYYHTLGLYSEAVNQYNQALEQIGANSSDTLYIALNNNIGRVYLSQNEFELAKQYFADTMNASVDLGYTSGQAISMGLLGSCYEKQGHYEKALGYQKESLLLFERLKDNRGIAMANENIGSIYEDLERFDLAYQYFQKAYGHLKGTKTFEEINVLNNLGDSYRKTEDYEKALHYTGMALQVAEEIGEYHQLESAHKDLSKTYALMGDYKNAHKQLMESERYNSVMFETQNNNQLSVLQTIYETNKKEAEIKLLKEKNKVSAANQSVLWVALFAIAAILTILYSYLGRKRKAKLKIQNYKQRMLKAELDKKEIEERNLQREVQLKTASLSRYSLHLAQKNKILLDLSNTLKNIALRKNMNTSGKIKNLVKEIDFNLQQEDEWDEFMSFFREIHPEFIKKLSSISENSLSPAELRLGMLLRLNLSSKEIASILRVTPDSVRVARHRLRKKLPIDQKEELVNFMIEL
ncbi:MULTISPECIES: tetratricopeptide repeat protein [Flavobacteriaceae]|uniref:tetratricopeptide repeat protein n=1 Tax=Flavobacteriaceae TaxID=49546 RepID=UPI001492FFC1|nr:MULTISPECIES: tetratricopeptide repeat protein [Allomuricauda]MDC6365408.1 tetratricopeptide repeat protein [Muricauda sp. AC10]